MKEKKEGGGTCPRKGEVEGIGEGNKAAERGGRGWWTFWRWGVGEEIRGTGRGKERWSERYKGRKGSNEWKEGTEGKRINGMVEEPEQEGSWRENSQENQNKEGEVEQKRIEKKGKGRTIMRMGRGG